MRFRLAAYVFLGLVLSVLNPVYQMTRGMPRHGVSLIPAAQAQSMMQNLLARLTGERLPASIVRTNGRIEATQVDVSAKYPGRLAEIDVEEGSTVTAGQVIGRISAPTYEAQLRSAQSQLQSATHLETEADAQIDADTSAVNFARSDYTRSQRLITTSAISQQTLEQNRRNLQAAEATLRAATARRDQARAGLTTAEAEVERIQAILNDMILVAPRSGRVQYQFARTGEVVSAGTRIVTILDLQDVYMTIFLPAADAGKLHIGDEARLVLDPLPQFVFPARVSFVSAGAQFTPKSVETQNEREKLMFRVRLRIDQPVMETYYQRVKAGVRGMGIVRTDTTTPWPADLQVNLPQ